MLPPSAHAAVEGVFRCDPSEEERRGEGGRGGVDGGGRAFEATAVAAAVAASSSSSTFLFDLSFVVLWPERSPKRRCKRSLEEESVGGQLRPRHGAAPRRRRRERSDQREVEQGERDEDGRAPADDARKTSRRRRQERPEDADEIRRGSRADGVKEEPEQRGGPREALEEVPGDSALLQDGPEGFDASVADEFCLSFFFERFNCNVAIELLFFVFFSNKQKSHFVSSFSLAVYIPGLCA